MRNQELEFLEKEGVFPILDHIGDFPYIIILDKGVLSGAELIRLEEEKALLSCKASASAPQKQPSISPIPGSLLSQPDAPRTIFFLSSCEFLTGLSFLSLGVFSFGFTLLSLL